jgi:hypothetical protein
MQFWQKIRLHASERLLGEDFFSVFATICPKKYLILSDSERSRCQKGDLSTPFDSSCNFTSSQPFGALFSTVERFLALLVKS